MLPGEIFIAKFPFCDVPGMKLQPVLLLTETLGPVPEALVAYVSSVVPAQILSSDLVIDPGKPEFANTHLKTISVLRLHKLSTIHSASIVRFPGVLNNDVKSQVDTKLRNLLKLKNNPVFPRIRRQPVSADQHHGTDHRYLAVSEAIAPPQWYFSEMPTIREVRCTSLQLYF